MTQAILNTLNNLEQILSTQEKVQKVSKSLPTAMDKSVDFRKVFETKVENKDINISQVKPVDNVVEKVSNSVDDKAEDNTEVNLETDSEGSLEVKLDVGIKNSLDTEAEEKILTISDIKESLGISKFVSSTDESDALILEQEVLFSDDFKELLGEISKDANVETSLDLTLARDINEIITQLKEAVEDTVETVEEIAEKTEEIAVVLQSGLLNNIDLDETLPVDIEVSVESQEVVSNVEAPKAEAKSDNALYNNLLAEVDKNEQVSRSDIVFEPELPKEKATLSEIFESADVEIIEFSENSSEEVVVLKPTNSLIVDELENVLDEEVVKNLRVESLSAESDMARQDSFMHSQTPQEHVVRALITQEVEVFEIKLEPNSNVQNSQQVQMKSVDINPSRIIDQITKQLEGLQNGSKVNIVLNPESLGKVNIQLMSTKEGLTAQFTVTTQEARDVLTKGLDGLRESLGAHGVAVDNVSIKLAEAQKSEYNQDWTEQEGSRGGNKGQKDSEREEKQKGLFEKMMAQATEDENGNV